MNQLQYLIDRIIDRVNVNLREPAFDVGPYVRNLVPLEQFARFYAFYGLTLDHPIHFEFNRSSIPGSYFLGKCQVDHCILYKSDIRGDELKSKGDVFKHGGLEIPLHSDEVIKIRDSYLIKNLVHSNSHDPESPEIFRIQATISMHYANIHGSPIEGSFIGPFATVDLTKLHDCVVGTYAYVQAGELSHRSIEDGSIFIQSEDSFEFEYRFDPGILRKYIRLEAGKVPAGILIDFVESRKRDFESLFEAVRPLPLIPVPTGASLSQYAVVRGQTRIGQNVLVAQRSYLEDAVLGNGSNAQENCYILNSRLAGMDVTAHGGKIIHSLLAENVFVGFNAFLHGRVEQPLAVGKNCIIMPHTIIDLEEPLSIPESHLVWGYIRNAAELALHSISLEELSKKQGELRIGAMKFSGSGASFVKAFRHRIEHILESNGARFDGNSGRGHAQKGQMISFNIIQPYPDGPLKGVCPTIDIRP